MEYEFVTDSFKNIINKYVVRDIFKNLNENQIDILTKYLVDIINTVAVKFNFNFDEKQIYEKQFTQNNYQDIKGLLNMLLPYIDDPSNTNKQNIRSLNDLYTVKKKGTDINSVAPKYEYSNIQYGRCKRKYLDNKEIQFTEKHLKDNYILLKQTIHIISNKLFVNWMNIRPYSLQTLKESTIYKITKDIWANYRLQPDDPNELTKNRGLYIGDMYNVISNNLFHAIKNIKWTIYDSSPIEKGFRIPFLTMLTNFLPIQSCVNSIKWNQLSKEDKNTFISGWDKFINLDIDNSVFSKSETVRLLKSVMVFFNKYYSRLSEAVKKNEYVKFTMPDQYDYDKDGYIGRPLHGDIFKSAQSLDPKHMYSYIRECMEIFKLTWYSTRMLEKGEQYKIKSVSELGEKQGIMSTMYKGNIIQISFKNYYNYAKSLTHYTVKENNERKYLNYPKYWRSLNDEDKKIILDRLNFNVDEKGPSKLMDWFNISHYFRITFGIKGNTSDLHSQIYSGARKSVINIILSSLMKNGTLTYFIPQPELTNDLLLPKDRLKKAKKQLKELGRLVLNKNNINSNWNDAYYFINNQKYQFMKLRYSDDRKVMRTISYLDYLGKYNLGMWFTTYAMNWISQISFFHHYINNRVIYVTGSTGVGKTSQMPKLLLYALKMVDYKFDGRIICNQPRISPATTIPIQISGQMGVPIEEYNDTYQANIRTYNYNLQFKHRKDSHTMESKQLMLRFATDGMFYQEFKNNPILKRTLRVVKDGKEEYHYTEKNLWDIVIVDEAHEHNKNMDLILTMMNYALYYNNETRLVIISATMDDDEPIYRRFYRNINDNRLYPFNNMLEKYNIDRINIDRRLHISPPGTTTRFNIEDYYEPGADPNELVLKIVSSSVAGDILLFQPGQGEISKSVTFLNSKLPSNVVAVPYYSAMSNEKREFIENLSEKSKKDYVVPQHISFDSNYDEDLIEKVPRGTYTRVIIVATNIAEASITINTLRYVVDTGVQKANYYDYSTRYPKLKLVNISESSRLQRRGRVGRVASGSVYYLYKEGHMENNTIQYNISISNVSDSLYDLLQLNSNELALFNSSNDPNSINNFSKITVNNVLKSYSNGLYAMILKQYFLKNKFIDYYGSDGDYDYMNSVSPKMYYQSGYSKNTLNDNTGTFYIIHPDELNLKRNIAGEIIDVTDSSIEKKNSTIVSEKMNSFWNSLVETVLIMSDPVERQYYKTDYGFYINNLKSRLDIMDIRYLITYIYSRKLNCDQDIIKLLSMLDLLNNGVVKNLSLPSDIGRFDEKNININKTLYETCSGDVVSLIEIGNSIINYINSSIIDLSSLSGTKLTHSMQNKLLEQKRIYLDHKKDRNFKGIDRQTLNQLIDLDSNNKLVLSKEITEEEIKEFIRSNMNLTHLFNIFESNENRIKQWCSSIHLDYKFVTRFILSYAKIKNDIDKYISKNYEVDYNAKNRDMDFEKIEKMLKIVPDIGDKKQKIIISLLYGFGFNIVRRVEGSNLFINVNSPHPKNIYSIKPVGRKLSNMDSFMKSSCIGEYLLYLNRNDDHIYNVSNVNPKLIQSTVSMIYSPYKFIPENYNMVKQNYLISDLIDKLKVGKFDINLKQEYINSVQSIRSDFVNSYNPIIWDSLMDFSTYSNHKLIIAQNKKLQDQYLKTIKGQTGGAVYVPEKMNYYNNIYVKYLLFKLKKLIK